VGLGLVRRWWNAAGILMGTVRVLVGMRLIAESEDKGRLVGVMMSVVESADASRVVVAMTWCVVEAAVCVVSVLAIPEIFVG